MKPLRPFPALAGLCLGLSIAAAVPSAARGQSDAPRSAAEALAPQDATGAWLAFLQEAKHAHCAIHDPVRNRMVVFGGARPGALLNDVWVLPLTGPAAWTQLVPAGTWPAARYACSAIYDSVRDRMVIFGGYDHNDVWALSLGGTPTWTQITPAGTPPPTRYHHSAIYDPVRDRMVVFGGYNGMFLNDAWELSLGEAPAWKELTPSGTAPSGRMGHSAIYDPEGDRMVIFAGDVQNDVWALSLGDAPAWTELAPTGTPPAGRFYHTAIHDPARAQMVVFGGTSYSGEFDDAWALSLKDTPAWTELAPAGALPAARAMHSAVCDPAGDRMVVFGGTGPAGSLADVWALSLAEPTAWAEATPPASVPPSPRYGHTAIHDPARDRMVVFGGNSGACLADVWALSLADPPGWAQLAPAGTAPPAREWHSAIHDPVRDRMVVFGGYDGSYLGDVWALSLAGTPAWTQLTPSGTPPSGRACHQAIYDPVRDRMLVFGGYTGAMEVNEVWALSLGDVPAWTKLTPTSAPGAARLHFSAVYDPVRDRMLVFGGVAGTTYYSYTAALSLSGTPAWTMLSTPDYPVRRAGQCAVYDPVRDRMVIFGGDANGLLSDEVWALSLAGTPNWHSLVPAGTAPLKRKWHSGIYDPARDRLVTFGGHSYTDSLSDGRALHWGEPALGGVTCPGDVAWIPGTDDTLDYGITNPYGFALTADYVLTSERGWPGFPVTGSVAVGAGSTVTVPVPVAVPDSTADGLNTLSFAATLRSVPQHAACSHHLHDVTTPVQLALVSAEAEPDLVRLTWYAASGPVTATVYRRTETTAWAALGEIVADGTGRLVCEDRAVTPGARYGYRLGVVEGGAEVFLGEAWVDVPLAARLSLAGAHPNPATSELSVAFSLPDASPARLEAFDLAGRRVAVREVGALGAGSHVVKLGEGARLGCGAYVLRLTQGERTLVTRAVIVR